MAPLLRVIALHGAMTFEEMTHANLTLRGSPLTRDDVAFLADTARRHDLIEQFVGSLAAESDLEWALTRAGQRETNRPLTGLAWFLVNERRLRARPLNERYQRLVAESNARTAKQDPAAETTATS